MTGFIRATFPNGTEGRFNIAFIVSIQPYKDGGTAIEMLGSQHPGYWVKESPEELYARMEQVTA